MVVHTIFFNKGIVYIKNIYTFVIRNEIEIENKSSIFSNLHFYNFL